MGVDDIMGPSQEVFTVEDLNRAVRRFSTYRTLAVINRVSAEEGKESEIAMHFPGLQSKGHKSPIFTQWGLAFVARHSILHSNDFRGQDPTLQDMAQLCHLYNGLHDPFMESRPSDPFATINFLLRTAYEQFPLQGNIRNLAARVLHLFDILPREMAGSTRSVDLQSIFQARTGLAIREFIQYGFTLWATSLGAPWLTAASFLKPGATPPFLRKEDLQKFLDYVSTDYPKFRKEAGAEEEGVASIKQAFNPLWRWPVIEPTVRDPGQYVVPIPRIILERVTSGLYHDFLHPDIPATQRKAILDFLGDVFEAYVGRLVEPYYGSDDSFHALPYAGGKETVDWILVEGSVAIILECKTKRLRKMSKINALRDEVREDLRPLVRAAEQLRETAEAILNRSVGLERLHHVTRVLPLVVVTEPIYLANSPPMRQLIGSELNAAGLDGFEFQVVSVAELELLLPWREVRPISDFLIEKFEHPGTRTWDLSGFMQEKPDPGRGHRALDSVSDQFFKSITGQDPEHIRPG